MGLGDQPEDTCGKDWQPLGGDYGDPDFAEAIASVRASDKRIPLVTFGHMHHRLRHTSQLRQAINEHDGTVYLNAASVPRIIEQNGERLRNFSLVTLENGVSQSSAGKGSGGCFEPAQVSLVWVAQDYTLASEQILYRRQTVAQPLQR